MPATRRADERFELHEGGLVHAHGKKRRELLWTNVQSITDMGELNVAERGYARVMRVPTSVSVKAAKDRSLSISGLVRNSESLVMAVCRAVEDGVRPGSEPTA